MPHAMKLAILAAAAAAWFMFGIPVADAPARVSAQERLHGYVNSQGDRQRLPLTAFGSNGASAVDPKPSRLPRVEVEPGERVGFTTVPRAAAVSVNLIQRNGRPGGEGSNREARQVLDTGRRWATSFGRAPKADFIVFDVFYPRDRRPRVNGGRVFAATYIARIVR